MGEEQPLADLFSFADFARASRAKHSGEVGNSFSSSKQEYLPAQSGKTKKDSPAQSEKKAKTAPRPRQREKTKKNQ